MNPHANLLISRINGLLWLSHVHINVRPTNVPKLPLCYVVDMSQTADFMNGRVVGPGILLPSIQPSVHPFQCDNILISQNLATQFDHFIWSWCLGWRQIIIIIRELRTTFILGLKLFNESVDLRKTTGWLTFWLVFVEELVAAAGWMMGS